MDLNEAALLTARLDRLLALVDQALAPCHTPPMSQSWSEVASELVDEALAAGAVVPVGERDDGAVLYEASAGYTLDTSTSTAIMIPVPPA